MKQSKTKTILIMAVCLIAVISSVPVFASGSREFENTTNALWYQAEELVDTNSAVLPAEKAILWEELSPSGDVITVENVTVFYSETEGSVLLADEGTNGVGEYIYGQQLEVDFAGDIDTFLKRNRINDGLLWTPFDEDVDDEDVTVINTGAVELVDGTECSVFNYTLYRDKAQYGYDFKETIYDDYEDSESNSILKVDGAAWIDGEGVLRKIKSSIKQNDLVYNETTKYDFDGSALFPVETILEGTILASAGDFKVENNFRVIETMTDYWTATDFYR